MERERVKGDFVRHVSPFKKLEWVGVCVVHGSMGNDVTRGSMGRWVPDFRSGPDIGSGAA